MARRVETQHDFGGRRFFDPQAFRAERHAAKAAHFVLGSHAPNIIPTRATRGGAQDGAFFLLGLLPGSLRGLAQFAMDFVGVAMGSQVVDVRIGGFDFSDFFAGEVGRESSLPELVFAFGFAFGLGRGCIAEADVIELECPTQLGQSVWIVGEEQAVVIHVELELASVGQESRGQEVEVGEQKFALVNLGAGEQTAAIIEHVKHREGVLGVRKPTVWRGVELPKFADLIALPAAHGGPDFCVWDSMGELVGASPTADLGAVEFEVVQAECLGSGKAVWTWGEQAKRFMSRSGTGCGHAAA